MGAPQPKYDELSSGISAASRPHLHSVPQVYLHRPVQPQGIPSGWKTFFGNKSQRNQQRKEFEQRRLVENTLILGIMLLVCLLVGVITYISICAAAETPAVQAPENEAGTAIEPGGYPVFDQDLQIR